MSSHHIFDYYNGIVLKCFDRRWGHLKVIYVPLHDHFCNFVQEKGYVSGLCLTLFENSDGNKKV